MPPSAENDPCPPRDDQFALLIEAARSGDRHALGELIQECREYLLLIANQDLDVQIKPKLGASDVVQESLLTAQKSFAKFTGTQKSELLAWIRQILKNDLRDAHRHFTQFEKRQVQREATSNDSRGPADLLRDQAYTPSTQAGIAEDRRLLEQAIAELSDDYREVLRLRNWELLTYAEIGQQLNRSEEAVRKLWGRAIVALKNKMQSKHDR